MSFYVLNLFIIILCFLNFPGLTGPTNSGSSHDEDSLSVPEMDDTPSQAHMQKRVRKRKAPNTPTFLNKPQVRLKLHNILML
jgi:hypothetical protein